MTRDRFARQLAAFVMGIGLSACVAHAADSNEPAIYKQGNLAGHILVNRPGGGASLVDLATGHAQTLPDAPDKPDGTRWTGDAHSSLLMRWSLNGDGRRDVNLAVYDLQRASVVRSLRLASEFYTPKLSPDGGQFLVFWHDSGKGVFSDEKNPLRLVSTKDARYTTLQTAFDDSQTVVSSPEAWLPDGSGFIYLVANRLYVFDMRDGRSSKITNLNLPSNSALPDGSMVEGLSELAVSPDGRRIAFTWREARGNNMDTHIWVAKLDGTDLHRATQAPARSSLNHAFVNPSWSPDSRWLLGRLAMEGSSSAPVFPDSPEGAWYVTGTTGCGSSPVFVLPFDARNKEITWPSRSHPYGITVKGRKAREANWLTACGDVYWVR